MVKRIMALAMFVALARCAATPVFSEKMALTEAPIRAAAELGASRVPQAALELKLAEDEMELAKQFLKDGNKQRADWLLLRAQADAELAVALAREAPLQAEAKSAMDQVKALQQSGQ
jgi:hypothetical protein